MDPPLGSFATELARKADKNNRDQGPETLYHPTWAAAQCGLPDVLLFDFTDEPIHKKYCRKPDEENPEEQKHSVFRWQRGKPSYAQQIKGDAQSEPCSRGHPDDGSNCLHVLLREP